MESAVEFNSGRLFVAQQLFRLHRAEYEALFGAMPALDDAARFPQLGPLDVGCDEGDGARVSRQARQRRLRRDERRGADRGDARDRERGQGDCGLRASAPLRSPRRSTPGSTATPMRSRRANSAARRSSWAAATACAVTPGPRLTDGAFHNVGLRPATVAVAFTDTGDRGAAEGLPLALERSARAATVRSATVTAGPCRRRSPRRTKARSARRPCAARRSRRASCTPDSCGPWSRWWRSSIRAAIPHPGYPGVSEIAPLGLDEQERADLVAFLRALKGPGPAPELLMPLEP